MNRQSQQQIERYADWNLYSWMLTFLKSEIANFRSIVFSLITVQKLSITTSDVVWDRRF